MKKFKSHLFPEMNPFLELLGLALRALNIDCEGFYLAFYNSTSSIFSSEKIGEVLPGAEFSFLHFSSFFTTMALLFGKKRSKNMPECKQGSVVLYDNSAGVNGEMRSDVAEAIAALWLITMNHLINSTTINPMDEKSFWVEFKQTANFVQRHTAPENNYIYGIAAEIEEQFKEKVEQPEGVKETLKV